MRIMIIGGGSLGLLFASKLVRVSNEVRVVTRSSEQSSELNANGLAVIEHDCQEVSVKPIDGQFEFLSIDELSQRSELERDNQFDYICLMVKQVAITDKLILQIQSLMTPNTYVICFQNGIGHERKLSGIIGEERILVAVTTEGAKRLNASTVAHTGRGITYIGGLDRSSDILAHPQHLLLAQLLERAGFHTILSKNMEVRVWSKLAINAVINPLTAILRVSNGGLLTSTGALSLMQDLYKEVCLVAVAQGITLPDDLWTTILDVCEKTSPNHSSMLQDVESSRPTEIDYMNGRLVQMARELRLELPINLMVYRIIKALEK